MESSECIETYNLVYGKIQYNLEINSKVNSPKSDTLVFPLFGLHNYTSIVPSWRLEDLTNLIFSKNFDIAHLNYPGYFEFLKTKKDFYSANYLFSFFANALDALLKDNIYNNIILIGWSFGSTQIFSYLNKNHKKIMSIKKAILIVPDFNFSIENNFQIQQNKFNFDGKISSREIHRKKVQFNKYWKVMKKAKEKLPIDMTVIMAEKDNKSRINETIAFAKKQNISKVVTINNATHMLTRSNLRSDMNLEQENRKIWNNLISEIDKLI